MDTCTFFASWMLPAPETKQEVAPKPSKPAKPRKKRVIANNNHVGAIVYLLRLGKKPKEIASFLGISTTTVSRVNTGKLRIKGG